MADLRKINEKIRLHKKAKLQAAAAAAGIVVLLSLGVWCHMSLKPAAIPSFAELADAEADNLAKAKETQGGNGGTEDGSSSDLALSQTEAPRAPVQITVSLTGDCTLGTDENFGWDTSLNAYYLTQGADYFLQNVREIFRQDDLTIVNLEGTLTTSVTREDKLFAFRGDPEFINILSGSYVEAATVANNHSHDYGEQSFTDTLEAARGAGITTFGYDETAVMDVKGIKVGLVGIYELDDHMAREQQLLDNIAKVKSEGAQIIITVFHWGNELETVPDDTQKSLAHIAIDNGADLVAGHHPHVLQGIEKYKGKYIAYSLGNFCFGGNTNPTDMDTIIFQQTFTVNGSEVSSDDNINIIPCSVSSEYYYNNYQPTPAQGDDAQRILDKIEERSQGL